MSDKSVMCVVTIDLKQYRIRVHKSALHQIGDPEYIQLMIKPSEKPKARQLLSVAIQAVLDEHPDNDNYGVNRMQTALAQRGIQVSRRTVYRAMAEMGRLHRRRKPHGTTKATTEIQDQENLIKRDFTSDKPLQKLLSDITEIPCVNGTLYLSAVLDCYNGEILSIAMDDNMKKELCIRTVDELKKMYGKRLNGGSAPKPPRFIACSSGAPPPVLTTKKSDTVWHRPLGSQLALGSHLCVALSSDHWHL